MNNIQQKCRISKIGKMGSVPNDASLESPSTNNTNDNIMK